MKLALKETDVTFAVTHFMLVDGNEWERWKARIWNQIALGIKGHPGLAPLEQWMRRSAKEQRCVDCGEPGTVKQESHLIACVSHYYHCDDCAAYWQAKS